MLCSVQQEADESLNFEEQILEAAKSIAAATSALVKAASACSERAGGSREGMKETSSRMPGNHVLCSALLSR